MNDGGLYMLPRLKRDSLREVITAPIYSQDIEVTPSLVQQILNDAVADAYVLPELQYTLRRTWEVWNRSGAPQDPIDHRHYDEAGGMRESINRGASEAFRSLSDNQQRLAVSLFQALVSVSEERTARRPATIREVADITGTAVDELVAVIRYFSDPQRAFLSPALVAESPDTIVDIGHEILLHRWDLLRGWVSDERASFKMLTRLDRLSEYGSPLSGRDIQDANDWLENTRPTEAWAAKYGVSLDKVRAFITSQMRAKREKRRLRVLLVAFISLAVLFAVFGFLVHLR